MQDQVNPGVATRHEQPPTDREFHVVGIGASAGGLEALERLFEHMPRETGMAFVVLQHLSPDFESHMGQLLGRKTAIPVLQVVDGIVVQPDTIYLIPPGKEMIISGRRLHLTDKDPDRLSLPIDVFFRSLANDQGRWAIGVVLSGTGSDASRGIRAIHDAGGLVICQSEETAKFDGMPRAALQTRVVDMVLAPHDIPRALVEYARRAHSIRRDLLVAPDGSMPPPLDGMELIFDLLRGAYGIDFAHYKPSTVLRRVDRRLAMMSATSLEEYAAALQQSPGELDALYQDLLIGVTRFFRDAEAFEYLERNVLPGIIANATSRDEIRVWCAGCATGEEAYSLAILLHELVQASGRGINVKIFATDVHRASLEFAGAGVYEAAALADVSPARLERYFVERNGRYQVAKDLRQMIVFAPHNVINDAPFTRLDLLTCRNLLIYLQPPAQKKAISLFHFGLKAGGYLFLGPSETPGELADEFDVQEKHWKFYRKRRDIRLPTVMRMPTQAAPIGRRRGLNGKWDGGVADGGLISLYDRLLGRYMPPGLLVDEHYNLVHTFGGAERFVRMPAGRPSISALDLILPELKTTVSGALQHCAKEGKLVRYAGVPIKTTDREERVLIQVEPYPDEKNKTTSFLVTFEAMAADPTARPADEVVDLGQMSRDRIESLETELRFTKESLQATIEELETSNEELQATNEELVASNEELQSTNEELHSVNEELYTVNAELQRKIAELIETTADLDSVLQTTEVGVLFLDLDLRIRKFTRRIVEAFQLLPQDVGRPIDAFSHKLLHATLVEDLRRVLSTGVPLEREVGSEDGHHYFLRGIPYRQNAKVAGVVVTLLDIGALRKAEQQSRMLSAIVESSADGVIATDLSGTVSQWNRGAERMYGYAATEMVGRHLAVIVPDEKQGELRDVLGRIGRGEQLEALETVRRRKDGAVLHVSLQVSPVRDARGAVTAVSSVDRDITARRIAEDQIRLAVEQRERFLAILSHELRNPLAAVVSAGRVLEVGTSGDLRTRALNVLKRQSAHMARLLDDLLDISRIRQGRLEIRKEALDLRQVIDSALETVGAGHEDKHVDLHVEVPPEPLPAIGDQHRLNQLVVNLVANAIRHSDAGARVSVSVRRRDDRAEIRVQDHGIGIAPELLPHVFEPFGIAHLKGPRAGGLGIGLWLVKTIAEAHGGSVFGRSEGVGRGTEFVVDLPLADRAAVASSRPVPQELAARILVVEDQKDIQELTEAILASAGASVVTADSAEEALERLSSTRPDIAIVDIGLPGMNGLELARRIRRDLPNERIRLIAMTGFGQQTDREAVFEAGFDQHLVKPVEIEVLLRAIASELDRLKAT